MSMFAMPPVKPSSTMSVESVELPQPGTSTVAARGTLAVMSSRSSGFA